jgi:hypothetical protein
MNVRSKIRETITLPVPVVFVALNEEHRLRVSESRTQTRVLGPRKQKEAKENLIRSFIIFTLNKLLLRL